MTNEKAVLVKQSKQNQYEIKLAEMKLLTSSLFNKNIDITTLIKSKLFSSSHRYRLFSYIKSNPNACWYINKHLNSRFIFGEKILPEDWINTFRLLFKLYDISKNTINYSRFQKNEFIEFAKLMRQYYEFIQENKSNGDIVSLYELYKTGIIHDDHINEIKEILNDKTPKVKKSEVKRAKKQISEDGLQIVFSNVDKIKLQRHTCSKCDLKNNPSIPVESNVNYAQDVDIALIGSFPYGLDDAEQKKLFLSDNLAYIKQELFKVITKHDLKYMMTNAVLCYNHQPDTTKKKAKAVFESCSEMSSRLINDTFPATIKVVLGAPANNLFGLRMIDETKGKLNGSILPLDLPKLKMTNKYKIDLELAFQSIDDFFIKNPANKQTSVKPSKINIDESKIIKRFTPNLTLFDIKQIKNQVIYILINEKGNKRYLIEDMQFPIYIKNGKYGDCDYIENKFDYVTYCNSFQRQDLNKLLYGKLEKWKYPL